MSPADGGPGAPPADSRLTKAYRTVALILLNTVLLFGFAECASMVSLKVLDMRTQDSDVHPYYTAQEWSESYWRDHRLQREVRHRVYEPYVIWTMRPFEGETVRVEEDGRRPTPGASCVLIGREPVEIE